MGSLSNEERWELWQELRAEGEPCREPPRGVIRVGGKQKYSVPRGVLRRKCQMPHKGQEGFRLGEARWQV